MRNELLRWGMGIGVVAVAFSLIHAYSFMQTQRQLERQAATHFETFYQSSVEQLLNLLKPARDILRENLYQADHGLLPIADGQALGLHFAGRMMSQPEIAWISFSEDATGRFVGARRHFADGETIIRIADPAVNGGRPVEFSMTQAGLVQLPDPELAPSDPRRKQWYTDAAAAEQQMVWTKPFLFEEGVMGITAARGWYDPEGALRGVFTVDFQLDSISDFLQQFADKRHGYAYLLADDGSHIAVPRSALHRDAEITLAVAMQSLPFPLGSLPKGQAAVTEFSARGEHYWAAFQPVTVLGGLTCSSVSIVPSARYIGVDRRDVWRIMIVGLLGAGLCIVCYTLQDHTSVEREPDTKVFDGGESSKPLEHFVVPQGRQLNLSRPVADLSRERLLYGVPRTLFNGTEVPTLGGIPLLNKLGQGAMGGVYYGYHPRLDREVAVKVMSFDRAQDDDVWIKRFYREAQMAVRVQSPHVVRVFDIDEQAGSVYMVMEFIDGITCHEFLDQYIERHRRSVSPALALDIIIAATKGVVAAHAQGVVHRDIKPDNILIPYTEEIDENGNRRSDHRRAKLADLGLAREAGTDTSLTAGRLGLGTPGYLAPEQGRDAKSAGPPADIFSIGATCYRMLAGRRPFRGDSPLEIMVATMQHPHAPITEYCPDIPPALVAVVDRCLAKEPQDRFPTAAELLRQLQACRAALDG